MDSEDFLQGKCGMCGKDFDICLISYSPSDVGFLECENTCETSNPHFVCVKCMPDTKTLAKENCPLCKKDKEKKEKVKEIENNLDPIKILDLAIETLRSHKHDWREENKVADLLSKIRVFIQK